MIDFEPAPAAPPAAWGGPWPQSPAEFERLVEAFQDRLVRFAFRRLGHLGDAEDVAQEVFARAYADRGKRRNVASVGAYLYRMAGNLCIDQVRRRQTRRTVPLEETLIGELPSAGPDAARQAAAAEEAQRIQRLLGRIPERQAEVVRLCVLDELAPRQIAEIIGRPEATVKSRLRYGLEKLREIIIQEREDAR